MYYSFPYNLKKIRKLRKMRQGELAKAVNLSQASISAYENGTQYPRVDKLYDLAKVLNVRVEVLLSDNNSKTDKSQKTC